MRFGANLLRGARPIHLDGGAPGPAGGGGSSLSALWSQHQKPILIGGAGVAVALGLMHRRNAGAGSADLAGMGTDPAAANGATVAGYQPADTSGTDVYNALQPQVEQTQSMLSQLLGAIGALAPAAATSGGSGTTTRRPRRNPRPRPRPRPKARPKKGKAKGHPKKHNGRPRSRFSTVAPAGRAVPRRAASPAPHKALRDSAHVVRKGETAASIAARHGTNAAALHKANSRLSKAQVTPGKRIVVPNPKKARKR